MEPALDQPSRKAAALAARETSVAGERALLNFICACLHRGLNVATPVVDIGYDAIVHNPKTGGMWRVQVKNAGWDPRVARTGQTWSPDDRGWRLSLRSDDKRRGRYRHVDRFVGVERSGLETGCSGFWIVEAERWLEEGRGAGRPRKDGTTRRSTKGGGGVLYPDMRERWDLFGCVSPAKPAEHAGASRAEPGEEKGGQVPLWSDVKV